ncbi:hypothetical protein BV133_457 [Blastochloris viridis]|uniref:Uncharacterized protein n=1 Tax=Blastochloris viridis TaxID=1079 RepID=A0A182CXX8_BLAVI|nr:hypothetical protein BV133_457 [Blastochloris viridis]
MDHLRCPAENQRSGGLVPKNASGVAIVSGCCGRRKQS